MPTTFQPCPSAAQRHPKPLTSPLFARAWLVLGACIVATWTLLVTPAQAQAQQRVALVIGNASYQNEVTLNNPANDAKLIDNTLRTQPLSFSQVTHVSNVNRVQLLSALSTFKRQAQGAEVALVYYSGHGMINSKRQNHVLPVDMPKISANAGLDADTALEAYGVSEDKLIEAISGAKVQVAVLDACRDNGFGASKSSTKGLSPRADESKKRLIAYATEEGRTAEDGKGSNSTYAASLAKHLVRTDWPLLKVFDEVASDVERSTGGQQSPTRSGNLRTDVYLLASVKPVTAGNGGAAGTATTASQGTVQASTPNTQPAQPVREFRDCQQVHCPEMVVIPEGSFVMGSSNVSSPEKPPHRVSVRQFAMGKFEVTQGQWKAVMGSNPSGFKSCRDDCPVEQVSWDDAQKFIQKLNGMTGMKYRLASEAEWEYAARAGCPTDFNVAEQCRAKIEASEANFDGNISYKGSTKGVYREMTVPVGSFKANTFGLHDMHGNVGEWVQDCYEDNYAQGQPTDGSAHRGKDSSCTYRVLRGGSWVDGPGFLSSAIRSTEAPDLRHNLVGFRLARTVP